VLKAGFVFEIMQDGVCILDVQTSEILNPELLLEFLSGLDAKIIIFGEGDV
jgi:uncharacterized protein